MLASPNRYYTENSRWVPPFFLRKFIYNLKFYESENSFWFVSASHRIFDSEQQQQQQQQHLLFKHDGF